MGGRIQACAGGIVFDPAGRILLIRRGTPPAQGTWSVPGGRCRPGESSAEACVREVAEETGLAVQVSRIAGTVDRDAPGGGVYRIDDYVCVLAPSPSDAPSPSTCDTVAPVPTAGDDADDARWVSAAELDDLVMAPGLRDCLRLWGLLPR